MGGNFISVRGLEKSFRTRKGTLPVLRGVDLDVEQGEVFGIIGSSGAGKSTLLRCVNRLETPDSGKVVVGGVEVTSLRKGPLDAERRRIGMIFQQFNLFDSRTVRGNVAFPLEVARWEKGAIESRVEEILDLVELSDKADCHPGQLSGGQKQRVGIARALANRPELLLSDEATSALDPATSHSILELLKGINRKLGLTILLVTHELDVVKFACDRIAVIEEGRIAESGSTRKVLREPESETARQFIRLSGEFLREFETVVGGEGI